MAFTKEVVRSPVSIGDISIDLFDPDPNAIEIEQKGATYNVQIRYSDGVIETRSGNLLPHITTAQRNGLQSFMASLRTQAATEFLP